MQITGMLYGARLLEFVGFPSAEVLGPDASEEQISALIDKHGSVFVKPLFKGGVGKKGKSGLIGRASDLKMVIALAADSTQHLRGGFRFAFEV